jgi:ATP-dependent Clp protease ATP-binding subunit ClpC
LAAVAYSRIQKELARDGRELGYQSNGMANKSISKKPDAGSATKTKGKKL